MRKGVKEFSVDNTDRSKTLDLNAVAGWQASAHEGFLPAWISSFRYCPIFDRKDMFTEFRKLVDTDAFGGKAGEGRVLIVMARKDETIKYDEVVPTMKEIMEPKGEEEARKEGYIKWKVYEEDGHDVPVTKGTEIADEIMAFWNPKPKEAEQVPPEMEQSWVQA